MMFQPQMQARFNAPVLAILPEHLLGAHLSGRPGCDEGFGLDFLGWFARAIDATGQPSGLLGKRKVDARGRRIKGDDAASFGASAIELTGLRDALRGKSARQMLVELARVVGHPFLIAFDGEEVITALFLHHDAAGLGLSRNPGRSTASCSPAV